MPAHSRSATVYPIAVRELVVSRIVDVTPGLRRITLTGDQLGSFVDHHGREWPAFASTGFDDEIRLIFPYPGESEPVLPILKDGGIKMPEGRRPIWRVYTVRRHDPVAGELDIEFVKHGIGIATTWAYRAAPGERIHVAGPPVSLGLPTAGRRLMVAGDDTALPAIARLLDQAPDGLAARLFIEIAGDEHQIDLPARSGIEVTWLVRGQTAHDSGDLLRQALIEATASPDWTPQDTAAWLAGEQSVVRDLRRILVAAGVDKRQIDFTGYWKRGEVVTLDTDPQVTDEEHNEEAFEVFHEQAEILPPLAIRAAANLGLGELIAEGVGQPARLAECIGADARALGKLMRYLAAIGLLDRDNGGTYTLTHTGHYLTDDLVLDVLHRDGVAARREQGFFGLEDTVRSGQATYAKVAGHDYADLRRDQVFAERLLDNTARFATYIAAPLADAAVLDGINQLVIHSDAAVTVASAVAQRHQHTTVTIVAPPSDGEWTHRELARQLPDPTVRQRVTVLGQTIAEPVPDADAILFGKALAPYPDPEAAHILKRAAEHLNPGGRILLIEDTLSDTDLDDHETEADLLELTLHGTGRRTTTELDAVIAAAGLHCVATETIGWGNTLRCLAP